MSLQDEIRRFLLLQDAPLTMRALSLLRLRTTSCRTLKDAIELPRRSGIPGWGEVSEQSLRRCCKLDWLPAGQRDLFERLLETRRKEGRQGLLRALLERKRPPGPAFYGLVLDALEKADIGQIQRLAKNPAPSEPVPEFAARRIIGEPARALLPPPEDRLADYLSPQGRLHADKTAVLSGARERGWHSLEYPPFKMAAALVPVERWSPEAAARLLPSWVLRRRITLPLVPRTLDLRAWRYNWTDFEAAFGELHRLDAPTVPVFAGSVHRLAASDPVWPSSTGTLRNPETFEQVFHDSLDRLTPVQADVLRLRLGLGTEGSTLSLQDAGTEIGLSAERVRQVQGSALKRIVQRERWPVRLKRYVDMGLPTDQWLPQRVVAARPLLPSLVATLFGREVCEDIDLRPARAIQRRPAFPDR